jgi:hypothetical protein
MTVRNARAAYFAANGFTEALYEDRWVKIRIGPIPITFPNSASRRRALPLHDLHHVATGYPTTFTGEAEISAWELAGGCRDYWAAWLFGFAGFAYGLVIAPRRTYRAFVRGRHSRPLYSDGWHDNLLDLTVAELEHRIATDPKPASWRDRLAFAGWLAVLVAPVLAVAVAVVALL